METIPKAECQKIGFFRKTHGVYGEMVLEFEPRFEFSVEDANRFFIEIDGLLVPFFISENGLRFKSGNAALVKFDGVESETYARRLVGMEVYLFQSEIIDEPEETVSPFLNFLLKDTKAGEIGTITAVEDYSGNIVMIVKYKGDDILVPFNEDFLVSVDEKQKILLLDLPEGLF